MFLEALKYSCYNVLVLFQILGEDQDVIKVDGYLALGDQVLEDDIHHPLEHGGQVGESEEHHGGLE